ITVDSDDNLIIVDWGNSRVQVFDKHGTFIRYIRCQVNKLYGPQDLAVINNTIAIADSGNHCSTLASKMATLSEQFRPSQPLSLHYLLTFLELSIQQNNPDSFSNDEN
ncbi:tripartite motif-containing 2, partial [Brachionus plicatilis]